MKSYFQIGKPRKLGISLDADFSICSIKLADYRLCNPENMMLVLLLTLFLVCGTCQGKGKKQITSSQL